MIKSYTDISQSKKLAEILPLESADMYYGYGKDKPEFLPISDGDVKCLSQPCWSLSALLDVLPKEIYRKDKIHNGMAYVPCYKWEITPNAIFYTDGINTMDYTHFGYGEIGVPLLDAAFIAICWLKNKGYLKTEKK